MRPQDMKVITGFCEKEHLEIIEGDMLTILDGRYLVCLEHFIFRCTIKAVSLWSCLITFLFLCLCRPDCYWWKGQNKRTSEVGTFPRHCVDPQRKLGGQCQKGGCTLTPTYTLCRTSLICKNYFEMPLF